MPKRNWKYIPSLTEKTKKLAKEYGLLEEEEREKIKTYISFKMKKTRGYAYNDHDNDYNEICLSYDFVDANPEEVVDQLILHELLHWEVGINKGHGYSFKLRAHQIGLREDIIDDGENGYEAPWEFKCKKCGQTFHNLRKPKWVHKDNGEWKVDNRIQCSFKCDGELEIIKNPFS